MRIKDIPVFSCDGCLYAAQTQDGHPACAKLQRLIDLNNDFCSWRIAADQDPRCEKCGGPTEGKGIFIDGHLYCQRCNDTIR